MKILFILPEYLPHQGGGIITFYRMWLPRLVALGHQVHVLIGSGVVAQETPSVLNIDGVSVDILDSKLRDKYFDQFSRYEATPGLRRYLAAAWAMWEQAKKGEGFDLVETTDWGLLFVPWVLQKKIPALVQMHGSCGQIDLHDPVAGEELQGTLIRLIEKQSFAQADVVQSYSKNNTHFWQQQTGRDVNLQAPAFQSLQQFDGAVERSSKGLVVGRVQRWKGPQILCQALRLMGDAAPDIDWMGRDTVYGERGQTTSAFLAESFPEVWNKRLHHKPQQPPEATAKLQAQAAFIVVPSTWDVFNFTCVEAMAAATPVICSAGAGASQWIENGVNGFVFENENAESLVQALKKFLTLTPTQKIEMGLKARATVLSVMDPDKIAAQRIQTFNTLIDGRSESAKSAVIEHDWIAMACSPSKQQVKELGFLDQLPFKKLARYLLQRSLTKIRGQ